MIDTNLTGVFHVSKAAAEFLTDGGRIINLASVSAMVGVLRPGELRRIESRRHRPDQSPRPRISQTANHGERVTPGVVLTEMGLSIPESARAQMLSQIPLSRFAEPDEIAAAILFLASDLAQLYHGPDPARERRLVGIAMAGAASLR